MHHRKEGLFERVGDGAGCCEELGKAFFDQMGRFRWVIDRAADADADMP